jgi:hypothetical protein
MFVTPLEMIACKPLLYISPARLLKDTMERSLYSTSFGVEENDCFWQTGRHVSERLKTLETLQVQIMKNS